MKIREKLTQHLEAKGLWPKEAASVIDAYVSGPIGSQMALRLDDDQEGYPFGLLTVVTIGVDHAAKEWLAENCPKHFARAMFEK